MSSNLPDRNDPPGELPKIFIALGANISSSAGAPEATLKAAIAALRLRGVQVLEVSSFHQTPAWPDPSDPPFTNAVARIETALQPLALLELLHEVETDFGRKRSAHNAPRTLDLDLIDYGGRVETGRVQLPHPRMAGRGFVLGPLAEIAPGWVHPVTGAPIGRLLAALS
ncbi:MAG TPA: 2-amino-4-hydroxy-6-hydroxymethyldihydropteridine diphosphokinase [Rhizomicrobium sp.]|jgi:2-amino-4-hydroxy-6-hydroxymethyldihydropteridine diphosphokinase